MSDPVGYREAVNLLLKMAEEIDSEHADHEVARAIRAVVRTHLVTRSAAGTFSARARANEEHNEQENN
jgi:hypothetical protein